MIAAHGPEPQRRDGIFDAEVGRVLQLLRRSGEVDRLRVHRRHRLPERSGKALAAKRRIVPTRVPPEGKTLTQSTPRSWSNRTFGRRPRRCQPAPSWRPARRNQARGLRRFLELTAPIASAHLLDEARRHRRARSRQVQSAETRRRSSALPRRRAPDHRAPSRRGTRQRSTVAGSPPRRARVGCARVRTGSSSNRPARRITPSAVSRPG